MSMVVAVFPDSSALKPIVDSLVASGADTDRLRVLTLDELPTELATSGVQMVWIGDVDRATEPGDLRTGTDLPGGGADAVGFGGDELLEGLSELGVPDGRTDDFAREVESGRMIVGYPKFDGGSQIRDLFSRSGATKIEEF